MATIDYDARLAKVQAAIDAILTGGVSSYEIDGQSFTKLDIEKLEAMEARLLAKINRASGRRARTVVPL